MSKTSGRHNNMTTIHRLLNSNGGGRSNWSKQNQNNKQVNKHHPRGSKHYPLSNDEKKF